jgi:P-type E1-E2 ATPase
MPCDAVLIEGQSVVNEAMLTGESVPVLKSAINANAEGNFDVNRDKKHTLYSGTEVVKTRATDSSLAVVIRTGFSTTKGLLVKAILFPRPSKFHFMRDSLIFSFSFGLIALIGVLALLDITLSQGSIETNILRWCDLVTIAIPPALPIAMTLGVI